MVIDISIDCCLRLLHLVPYYCNTTFIGVNILYRVLII